MLNRVLLAALAAVAAFIGWDYVRVRRAAQQDTAMHKSVAPLRDNARVLATKNLGAGLPVRGQWRGHPALADLDGDGHLDLVASVRRYERDEPGDGIWVWRGDGAGHWQPQIEGLRRDMGYGGAEVGDIDGDGKPDVAFSGHDVPPHVFMNNLVRGGGGSWVANNSGIDCNVMCLDVALGDIDGDGSQDLACVGLMPKQGGLYVYRGDGHGGFSRLFEVLSTSHYGADVRIVDLNGDKRGELIAATDTGCRVWRLDASGELVDIGQGLSRPAFGGVELALLPVELDGTPGLELVAAGLGYSGYPSLRIYRRHGETWQAWGTGLPDDLPWYDVTALRVSGDGQPRLVAAGKVGVYVIEVSRAGACTVVGKLADTKETLNIAAGDIDGDGSDDVAYVDFNGVAVVQIVELSKREEKVR
jgi:hypothetical protein